MYRPYSFPLTFLLLSQAAAFHWPVCDASPVTPSSICETSSLVRRQSEEPSFPPAQYFDGTARVSSILATTNAPKDVHHRVGVIVGACLGTAGGVLLIGLGLFWILLRHRQHTATAQAPDVVPRSWVPSDFLRGHSVPVIANHPSMSLDLAGTDAGNASVIVLSEEMAETKRRNRSTDVLDISLENAPQSPHPSALSPVPAPTIAPCVPTPLSNGAPTPTLHIRTDVRPELRSSPPGSQDEPEGGTSAESSRSPVAVRPLPTPPTARPQLRWPRSSKADEAQRESRRISRRSRSAVSAGDLRAYVLDRRTTAHSMSSVMSGSVTHAGGCEFVQHHDGGISAQIDLPPPYYECLPDQRPTPPSS